MRKGFIYKGGTYTYIIPPGWIEAEALAINDNGVVVGSGCRGVDFDFEEASCTSQRGFIYDKGNYTEIMPPGDWGWANALAINNKGTVVGVMGDVEVDTSEEGGYEFYVKRGFVYDGGSYFELLPPRWEPSFALAINDSGVVVGGAPTVMA